MKCLKVQRYISHAPLAVPQGWPLRQTAYLFISLFRLTWSMALTGVPLKRDMGPAHGSTCTSLQLCSRCRQALPPSRWKLWLMSDSLLVSLWHMHRYIFQSKMTVDDTTWVCLFSGIMRTTIKPQAISRQEWLSAELPDQTRVCWICGSENELERTNVSESVFPWPRTPPQDPSLHRIVSKVLTKLALISFLWWLIFRFLCPLNSFYMIHTEMAYLLHNNR